MADLVSGLADGNRFRCDGCGNVTRFDVVATTRSRTFHHFDLGGDDVVEDEEILERAVESVICHWCGHGEAISVEPAPAAGVGDGGAGGDDGG